MTTFAYSYPDVHSFRQAAFDEVAKIVHDKAETVIMSGCSAPSAQKCLEHLEGVCADWGYNPVRITAYSELVEKSNTQIREMGDAWGDDND